MIKVLLVDDHDIVRAGISRLLNDVPGIQVVNEASSGEDSVSLVRKQCPDVVLMDVKMPGMGGLEATKKLLRVAPDLKVIILSVCTEEPFPSKMLQIGVYGYLTKGGSLDEMVKAIKTVYSGKKYLCPSIATQLAFKSLSDTENPVDSLSERELQILLLIVGGKKVPEISKELCISPKTTNSYRYRLFSKLSLESDVELTHFAIKYGLLDMETAT